jgi:hypothetical protein
MPMGPTALLLFFTPLIVVLVVIDVVPVLVEVLVGEAVLEAPVLEPLLGLPHVAHQRLVRRVNPLEVHGTGDGVVVAAVPLLADVRVILHAQKRGVRIEGRQ